MKNEIKYNNNLNNKKKKVKEILEYYIYHMRRIYLIKIQ